MAITLAQTSPTPVFIGATSKTITFGAACTPGSRIVVMITADYFSRTVTSITDSAGNTYSLDKTATGNAAGGGCVFIYSAANSGSGAVTVSVSFNASVDGYLIAHEVLGLATSSVIDATGGTGAEGASLTINGNLTTTAANSAIFAVTYYYPSGATADSGYTANPLNGGGGNGYHSAEYILDAGAAGAKTIAFGSSANKGQFSVASVAYKILPPPSTNVGGAITLDDVGVSGGFTATAVTVGGAVTLDDVVVAGGFSLGNTVGGAVTLDDVVVSGGFSIAPKTVVTLPLTRNTGSRPTGLSVALAVLSDDGNLTRYAGSTGISQAVDGTLTFTSASLPAPGASVLVLTRETDGKLGVERYTVQ